MEEKPKIILIGTPDVGKYYMFAQDQKSNGVVLLGEPEPIAITNPYKDCNPIVYADLSDIVQKKKRKPQMQSLKKVKRKKAKNGKKH